MYGRRTEAVSAPYQIEKGVPISGPKGAARIYPFPTMELGDSFAFPEGRDKAVRQAAIKYAKLLGRKYRTSGKELRCWRTA